MENEDYSQEKQRKHKDKKRTEDYEEYDEDDKGFGIGFGFLANCRILTCLGCLIPLIIIGLISFAVIAKPNFAWTPISDFLNSDKEVNIDISGSAEEASESIKNKIRANGFGESEISVSEEEALLLARESFPELNELTVDFEDSSINLYWIIASSNDSNLLGHAVIVQDENGDIQVEKLGTPRVSLPKFMNNSISSAAVAFLSFGEDKVEQNNLINQLLDNSVNYEIKDFRVENDELILTLNVDIE